MNFDKNKAYNFLTELNKKIPDKYQLTIVQNKKAKKIYITKIYREQNEDYKPVGIWISGKFNNNENSWVDWIYEEKFYDWFDPKKCIYFAVKIIDDCKLVLKLDTLAKVKKFHKKYSVGKEHSYTIDWKRVQMDGYYGVSFEKYFTELKKDINYTWYSTIDVSCKCIWDHRAIEDVIKISI